MHGRGKPSEHPACTTMKNEVMQTPPVTRGIQPEKVKGSCVTCSNEFWSIKDKKGNAKFTKCMKCAFGDHPRDSVKAGRGQVGKKDRDDGAKGRELPSKVLPTPAGVDEATLATYESDVPLTEEGSSSAKNDDETEQGLTADYCATFCKACGEAPINCECDDVALCKVCALSEAGCRCATRNVFNLSGAGGSSWSRFVGWSKFCRKTTVVKQAANAVSAFRGVDLLDGVGLKLEPVVSFSDRVKSKVVDNLGKPEKHSVEHRCANKFNKRVRVVRALTNVLKFKSPGDFTQSDADMRALAILAKQVVEDAIKKGVELEEGQRATVRDQEGYWYKTAIVQFYFVRDEDDTFWDEVRVAGAKAPM